MHTYMIDRFLRSLSRQIIRKKLITAVNAVAQLVAKESYLSCLSSPRHESVLIHLDVECVQDGGRALKSGLAPWRRAGLGAAVDPIQGLRLARTRSLAKELPLELELGRRRHAPPEQLDLGLQGVDLPLVPKK